MTDSYPWYRLGRFHPRMMVMLQQCPDLVWEEPRQFATLALLRNRRCQMGDWEECRRHPWLWSANRLDQVAAVGQRLEDVLPAAWRNGGLAYVRWWIETQAPDWDRRTYDCIMALREQEARESMLP